MTLKEANNKLEQLNNDYNYWLREKEIAQRLVLPQSTDTTVERVEGGKRVDKMLKYAEIVEDKQIDETLEYIHLKILNMMEWIDNELKILKKYNKIESKIYKLRNDEEYMRLSNGKKREWWKIGNMVGLSSRQCQRIYSRITRKRYNE